MQQLLRRSVLTGSASLVSSWPQRVAGAGPLAVSSLVCCRGHAAAASGIKQAFAYCVDQVKAFDYENYVWLLQLPQELRAALFALRAFNVETALVGEHVREVNLVPIRMQWWRDAVNSLYSTRRPVEHPVISAMHQVNAVHPLTRYRLQRIINTRADDVMRQQDVQSVQDLEAYAEGTASQLLYLQLEAAGVASQEADHAASHLGKAVGLATLLRGTSHHARKRRIYLPADLRSREGAAEDQIFACEASQGLSNAVFEVASVAKGHLDKARAMTDQVQREARPLMLPAVACGLYLDALQRQDFNVFAPALQKGGFSRIWHQLQVKLKYQTGQY